MTNNIEIIPLKKRITKRWFKKYFGFDSDPEKKYSSLWQTEGGTGTRTYDWIDDEYAMIHQTFDKTYWGKKKEQNKIEQNKNKKHKRGDKAIYPDPRKGKSDIARNS